jgi:membrane peptidoglycan carboxypeptidase
VFYVKDYLEEKYGKDILESGGFDIFTTIDPTLQDKAEEIVKARAEVNLARFDANNAALLSLDNENGEILAMVG